MTPEEECNKFTAEQSRRMALFAVRLAIDPLLEQAFVQSKAKCVLDYNKRFKDDAVDETCGKAIASANKNEMTLKVNAEIVQCTHTTTITI